MLHRMSNARQLLHIAETAHIDVHGGRSLVGVGIVNEQGLELVWQFDDSVGALVEERLLESLGQTLNTGGSAVRDGFSHGRERAT